MVPRGRRPPEAAVGRRPRVHPPRRRLLLHGRVTGEGPAARGSAPLLRPSREGIRTERVPRASQEAHRGNQGSPGPRAGERITAVTLLTAVWIFSMSQGPAAPPIPK